MHALGVPHLTLADAGDVPRGETVRGPWYYPATFPSFDPDILVDNPGGESAHAWAPVVSAGGQLELFARRARQRGPSGCVDELQMITEST